MPVKLVISAHWRIGTFYMHNGQGYIVSSKYCFIFILAVMQSVYI